MNRRFGLLPAGCLCWLAAGLLIGCPDAAPPTIIACAVLVAALLVLVLRPRPPGAHLAPRAPEGLDVGLAFALIIALAATAVVAGVVAVRAHDRNPGVLQEWGKGGRQLTAEVTVTSLSAPVERAAENAWSAASDTPDVRFRAQVSTRSKGRESRHVSFPALVFAPAESATAGGPALGSALRVTGRWVPTPAGDRVSALVFSRVTPVVTDAAPAVIGWGHDLRRAFLRAAAPLPGWGGQLLPGLAIGDTSAVGADLDAAMTASSLSHLTAVSGANCAIVVAIGFALGGTLSLRRPARVLLAAGLLGAFVVIVTPEPSVIRASVMACAVLVALVAGRPTAGLAVLSTVVVVLLAADPWLARDYGFALSVLATGGLLVLTRPLTDLLARITPRPVAAAFALPLAAQLACQPVLVLLDPSLAVYGVVANLLAGPAAPAATIVGLVACLLSAVSPWLAVPVAWLAWLPSAWIALVAAWFEDAPGARLPLPPGFGGVILSVVVLFGVAGVAFAYRAQRRTTAAALAVCLVGVSGMAAGSLGHTAVRNASAPPAGWTVASCDVGQGDATVVRDGEHVALIDVGADEDLLARCLDRLDVARIDLLVLTHFDADHVGAYAEVVGRADDVLVGPTDGAADERIVEALERGGARVRQVAAGESGLLGTGTTWTVLWPPARGTVEPGNDASVVVATSTADASDVPLTAVFLGDLGEEAQNRLRRTRTVPADVDIVKVAHHGSRDQSASLYERLSAAAGLVSVGENDYGHPTASILDTLQRVGTRSLRTDTGGIIAVGRSPDDGGAKEVAGARQELSVWMSGPRVEPSNTP